MDSSGVGAYILCLVPASAGRKTQETGGPWYAEGVRFECKPDCGRCCTHHGTYAYVYLEGDDLERLASHLGLTPEEFRKKHTRRQGPHTVLRMDGPKCPFLDGTRCGVYEARPTQCRTFPFWPDLVDSPAHWRALKRFCPGIGEGPLIPIEAIREQIAEHGEDG